jgi:hypothetical protein
MLSTLNSLHCTVSAFRALLPSALNYFIYIAEADLGIHRPYHVTRTEFWGAPTQLEPKTLPRCKDAKFYSTHSTMQYVFHHCLHYHQRDGAGSRDSSVGIALGYGLDYSRVRFPAGAGNFSLHHRVQNGSGVHSPPIQWAPGDLSLGVKRPGRETDYSPLSSAEVKECVELYLHAPNTSSWRGA